jgi:hypothetical protein
LSSVPDKEFEFLVAEPLKPLVIFLHHDALCGLIKGQRFQLEAGVDGANGLVGRHFVCLLVLEPLDPSLLKQEPLLTKPLSVLLHPLKVLAFRLLLGAPVDLGDAVLMPLSRLGNGRASEWTFSAWQGRLPS